MTNIILFIFLHLFAYLTVVLSLTGNDHKTYIIHIDPSLKPAPFSTHESWHASILHSLSANEVAATLLYSYNHVLNCFSASLSSSQLDILKQMPGHIAAFPETYGTMHTTHTPKYLGLSQKSGIWPASNYGDGVIIGVVDSGIWPESKSFLDKGMALVPSKWKGKCEQGVDFTSDLCNRKLVGARSFSKSIRQSGHNISTAYDYDSARDFFGHGTHTSSTAAGSPVRDVSYFGYAEGTMTGIAPKAHVAMYKAVFYDSDSKGAASDVLAAMDQAIEDGVDVMSISLGFHASPFYEDVTAIGAFAAMKKGISVCVSAGNRGPRAYTVTNSAPWFTSVGAGTIDRDYNAAVRLGDSASGIHFSGRSIFPENIFVSNASFYFGADDYNKGTCKYLVASEVVGKFVFCAASNGTVTEQMTVVDKSGAKGAIFATDRGQLLFPDNFKQPYVAVSLEEGLEIKQYLTEATGRTVTVDIKFIQTTLGFEPAPQVAYFSSRGPSLITPGIMKPDILAPGVNVLSSWVPNRGWVLIGNDSLLLADYVFLSGTSMAAPHIAGVAALVKSVHPDWSPAAVRSAMMTTADIVDNTGGTIVDMNISSAGTPLDFGAGHVNPNRAMDPGLVYDIGYEDYLNFVCGLNYTDAQNAVITGRPGYDCSKVNLDLNYPALMVVLNNKTNVSSQVFTRVLTSVVDYPSSYSVAVYEPSGMNVTVQPSRLYFEGKGSMAEYSIKVDVDLNNHESEVEAKASNHIGNYGFISWNEIGGKHEVRSPIVSTFAP